MFKARLQTGQEIILDDYREAYHWVRDHTPADARVMAWWDYGYQIAGIAKRTSIADGNTWNHEHIATLGRILTAPEEEVADGHKTPWGPCDPRAHQPSAMARPSCSPALGPTGSLPGRLTHSQSTLPTTSSSGRVAAATISQSRPTSRG